MKRMRHRDVEKGDESGSFWFIEGIGWMGRKTFRQWLWMVEKVGAGTVLPPPCFNGEPSPDAFPALTPAAEQAGIECLAEGLFRALRASGKFRRLEAKADEMEQLLRSTRELLQAAR